MRRAGLAMLLAAASSVAAATCKEDVDKFGGGRILMCGRWPYADFNALTSPMGMHWNPRLQVNPDGTREYQLQVKWSSDRWLFIPKDSKIIALIDGEKVELVSPDGSGRRRDVEVDTNPLSNLGQPVTVEEIARFPTDRALLERIANAKQVEFALYTDRGRIEGNVGKFQRSIFREFIEKDVTP